MLPLSTQRHSLSHIMAQAVRMVAGPNTRLAIGPDVDNGWYYDIDFMDKPLEESQLKDIEKKMRSIVREGQIFRQFSLSVADAKTLLSSLGETYKLEMVEDLATRGETMISFFANIGKFQNPAYASFAFLNAPMTFSHTDASEVTVISEGRATSEDYRTATFIDMCQGPHVEKTSDIAEDAFALDKLAGAYWRGDEKNKMLTRVYGLSFNTAEELTAYKTMMDEAKKRDHRILGKKLKLFTLSDLVGSGLPLLQPHGAQIKRTLEDYLWSLHSHKGYVRVWTPHLAKEALYETSGHLAHYKDDMFMVEGGSSKEHFCIKPMNCPHHMQIFADNQWSYRDMPVRYFEPATVYRDEKSGQLGGLTRVRAITQDDGHLFCRSSQIHQEVATIVEIIKEFYTTMGMIDGYWVRLSLRGEDKSNYLGGDEVWEMAEGALKAVCEDKQLPYRPAMGEAAFYGPKLDFMFRDAIGREWQLATIQCDFNLPQRFDLTYANEAGEKERPVVIHRAISGSLERFMGVMIEHFAGAFPFWLAPEQLRVLTVVESVRPYVAEIKSILDDVALMKPLRFNTLRYDIDDRNESLGKKIRNAEMDKIPVMIIV